MTKDTDKAKLKPVTMHISIDDWRQMKAMAADRECSASSLVRKMIKRKLSGRKNW